MKKLLLTITLCALYNLVNAQTRIGPEAMSPAERHEAGMLARSAASAPMVRPIYQPEIKTDEGKAEAGTAEYYPSYGHNW